MIQKKILVAVDGSTHSDKVVETAIEYAGFLKAKIVQPLNNEQSGKFSKLRAVIKKN